MKWEEMDLSCNGNQYELNVSTYQQHNTKSEHWKIPKYEHNEKQKLEFESQSEFCI